MGIEEMFVPVDLIEMPKRFYCGAKHIAESNGTHKLLQSLPDTLLEAERRITAGEVDVVYIVEVIKIVRRARVPVLVQNTR